MTFNDCYEPYLPAHVPLLLAECTVPMLYLGEYVMYWLRGRCINAASSFSSGQSANASTAAACIKQSVLGTEADKEALQTFASTFKPSNHVVSLIDRCGGCFMTIMKAIGKLSKLHITWAANSFPFPAVCCQPGLHGQLCHAWD
jgi:hypothetical protein